MLASRSGRVVRDGQGLAATLSGLGSRARVIACDSADLSDSVAPIPRETLKDLFDRLVARAAGARSQPRPPAGPPPVRRPGFEATSLSN